MPEPPHDLPKNAPAMASLADFRGSEFLPFPLYTLIDLPYPTLANLAKTLEGDAAISTGENDSPEDIIHLVVAADESIMRQPSLKAALDQHLQYCKDHNDDTEQKGYFPFGFLAVHDRTWETEGVWLVYVDFEDPFSVTAFRLQPGDVERCCASLRDDDEGVVELRDQFGMR